MPEAPKTKNRRRDCYRARVLIDIPLDMTDASSLANAITAVGKIKDGLPAGAAVKIDAALAKV